MESEGHGASRGWMSPERLPSRSNASKGKGIARTRPVRSLRSAEQSVEQEAEGAPEPTGAERAGNGSGGLQNAMNPRAGSRLQHTCTPKPEQTLKAEQDREEGTRTRPAGSERSFTAADDLAPLHENRLRPAIAQRTGQGPGRCSSLDGALRRVPFEGRAGVDGIGMRERRSNPGFS